MNKASYIFLFVLLPSILFSQLNWVNSFQEGFLTGPRDFTTNEDGSIYVGGYLFDDTQTRNVMLLKIDELTGDSIKLSACAGAGSCDNRNDILSLVTGANGLIYSSGSRAIGDGHYFARLNNTNGLDLDWINEDLFGNDLHQINQLISVEDGIIAIGVFATFRYNVIKFDYEGNILWNRSIMVSDNGTEPKANLLPNGTLAMLYKDQLGQDRSTLSFIDSEGEISQTIQIEGSHFISCPTHNNEVLIVEYIEDFAERWALSRYALNEEKRTLIEAFDPSLYPRLMVSDNTGNIFIEGEIEDTSDKEGSKLTKYSGKGELISSIVYFDDESDIYFSKMKLSEDQKFVLLMGEKESNEVIMMSIGTDFNVAIQDAQSTHDFKLFPNPTTNRITIITDFGKLINSPNYVIHDCLGREIMTGSITSPKMQIDLANFKSGIYILSVLDKDRIIQTTKFNIH